MKRNYDDTGNTATLNPPQGTRDQNEREGNDPKEMAKTMEAAAKPGPAHKALGHFVGDWKVEVKCWAEPGQQPKISQGTAKGTWTMNGLFLQEDFHGEMMGRPFSGRTLLGYDNVQQKFKSVWICDAQTSMFVSEGKGEKDYKVITLEGTSSCPMKGEVRMKSVYRIVSPDKHTFEMFDVSKGGNTKSMEINYLRT